MKKYLIFGANSQLGRDLCVRLSTQGEEVYAVDILGDDEFFSDLNISFFRVKSLIDMNSMKYLSEQFGEVNGIVNFVGKGVYSPTEARKPEEIDDILMVNIKCLISIVTCFTENLIRANNSSFINIGSIYGLRIPDKRIYGNSGRLSSEIYGATKSAAIHLTKYYAAYFGAYKTRFNTVSPGGIFNHQSHDFVANYENKVPMGRMGEPRDVSDLILFLLSDESQYITGQNIVIDGGYSLW